MPCSRSRRIALPLAVTAAAATLGLVPTHTATAGPLVTTRHYFGGGGVGDGGPAIDARILFPGQLAVDPQGRRVFTDVWANEVRRVELDGTITRLAGGTDHGSTAGGFSGDGGPAVAAELSGPRGVAVAADGTIYVADTGNNRIRKVATDGIITTIAGTGSSTLSAADTPALSAPVSPWQLRLAPNGDLYFSENGTTFADVRRLTTSGTVQLVAGSTTSRAGYWASSCPDTGGAAAGYCLHGPAAPVVDADGNLFFADEAVVFEVPAATGQLVRIAGINSSGGNSGDGGAAIDAQLGYAVTDLDLAADGRLLTLSGGRVRVLTPGGTIETDRLVPGGASRFARTGTTLATLGMTLVDVAPDGTQSVVAGAAAHGTGDGLPVTEAAFGYLSGMASAPDGSTVVAEKAGRVWSIDALGIAHRIAGSIGDSATFSGEGGPATDAVLPELTAVAVGPDGAVFVGAADATVRKVSGGVITTVAGTGTPGNGGNAAAPATTVPMAPPRAIAVSPAGQVDILDSDVGKVRALTSDGNLATVVGGGSTVGRPAVGQAATVLDVRGAHDLAFAPDGTLLVTWLQGYVADHAWAYRISGSTVTQAFRVEDTTFDLTQAADGTLMQGAYSGLTRYAADGSSDVVSELYGLDGNPTHIAAAVRGTSYLWTTRNYALGSLWAVDLPAPGTRPAAVTSVKVGPPNNLYVSWTKPSDPDLVVAAIVLPGSKAARNVLDGDAPTPTTSGATQYVNVGMAFQNEPSVTPGSPVTVSLFVHRISTGVNSAPVSVTVNPRYAATCAVKVSSAAVTYGQRVTLTGTLKSGTTPLAGRPVSFTATPYGLKASTFASTTTSSTGTALATHAPVRKTTYGFVHPADQYIPCSAAVVVSVKPLVAARLAATAITHGGHTTLSTSVAPTHAGQRIYLQRLYSTTWKNVSSTLLGSTSRAAFSVGSATKGTLRFRTYKPADADHLAAYSPVVTLTVR